ncbi:HlyD family efflux transporter periplasmic adaptor subunit [Bradyrhizobium diazoefficiens]|nr:HlyD family efflux transporter periplasmic adaptor subunit [Bradyrhizobium diazoefficiens]UCF51790.1 MAG: HlyD family efflux transporter periplasmic adaptor subunit [Bradyrhizobium sp.]MBR0968798.1 HlyD family efflux transporter periplasmic adaptor subunit [Bradyrhizobium diazoefficiens]MBR0982137.1 HlyD family efflux transporter periplasmic adaptor subunit [Bradyrhizobium diazoefficiens]MBR1011571.1 HlyD family efflux transporter periplasmic adaptor subunit [Bradyrhizobium diazoefficiens]M
MRPLPARSLSRHCVALTGLLLCAQPVLAADDDAPKGPAVTVLKVAKSCFSDIVEATGTIIAREETSVRPERPGLKVTDVLAEAGDTTTAGQVLARLALPEGGSLQVTAPVAGVIATSTAQIGNLASAKGEALFTIVARSEYDLVGMVATSDIKRLAINQPATVRFAGAGDIDGKVRRIGPTVEPNIQQGLVYIAISSQKRLLLNASGRALIKTGQSCNVAVPLTSVQYSSAGTVVQVIRRNRVETKRVETGLMSGGNIEVREGLNEGDIVVARAGALLREGDPVRPVMAAEAAK